MALRTELHLGRAHFQREWQRTKSEVKRGSLEMRRDTGGIGGGLADGARSLGRNVMGAIGLGGGVAGIGAGIKSLLQRSDDIADLTQALNESAETLQRVDYAAQQAASVGVDRVAKAMLKLEDNLGDVENTRVADALGRIGVSAQDLIGLPLDQKLLTLSSAFQNARATGVGLADAKELLGRSAEELIPLLNLSRDALEDMFGQAPVLADEAIQKMAMYNDKFDAMVMKTKGWAAMQVDEALEWGKIIGDVFATGSIDEALMRAGDRATEAEQARLSREEARQQQADAVASSRDAIEEESAIAKDVAELEKLQRMQERLEEREILKLPDAEKIEALQAQIAEIAQGQIGDDSIFQPTASGLQSFADSLEVKLANYGGDRGPLIEALEALDEVQQKEEEIAEIRKKIADEIAAQEKERLDNLAASREEAEEGRVALLSPEEQFREMRRQLEESLGIEIEGGQSLERGLQNLRAEVQRARESGDTAAEQAALDRLNQAQDDAREFVDAAERFRDATEAPVPTGPTGAVQGLVNQIFGRDPQQQQIEELRRTREEIAGSNDILADILLKMDDPPTDTFDDFGTS